MVPMFLISSRNNSISSRLARIDSFTLPPRRAPCLRDCCLLVFRCGGLVPVCAEAGLAAGFAFGAAGFGLPAVAEEAGLALGAAGFGLPAVAEEAGLALGAAGFGLPAADVAA